MSAFLPHHDPDPDARSLQLEKAQAEYQYNYTYVSPLAMVDQVPFQDEFSWKWLVQCGEHSLRMLANHIEVDGDPVRKAATRERHGRFSDLVHACTCDFKGIVAVIEEAFGAAPVGGPLRDLQAFDDLFRAIGLPAINKDYKDDRVFAEMRLAGPNPLMLRRVAGLDDRFPVTDADLQASLPGDSLAAAGAEGRLYLVDFAPLKDVKNGGSAAAPKYLYAPLALFALDRVSRRLVPVAIQCGQEPGPDAPIFTPRDGPGWLIAKTIVEVADGNYHEAVSHLGRTHLFLEPFVIATCRRLASNHPLSLLLRPHFEGTLKINDYASRHLIDDGGPVDRMCGGEIRSMRTLAVRGVLTYPFNDSLLTASLAARGVDDPTLLPNYPYRDDALLYWKAIRQWVADYLAIYYVHDADLQIDEELLAWFRELTADDGGRVIGLGLGGALTRDYLIDVIAHIIFTSSVQHAAVNFPQYDLMTYVPYMPLACYRPAPKCKEGLTLADYIAMLPPSETALLQVNLGYLLGSIHYTTLGQYPMWHFGDRRVWAPLQTFEQELFRIGRTIKERNLHRRPYSFLQPAGIPQSINI